MEPTLTPEQQKQLASWASKRDVILADIAVQKTENEKLTITGIQLSLSNTEVANKIQQSIGRLEELDKQESLRASVITKETAELIAQKSTLQTEVSALLAEIAALTATKTGLSSDIDSMQKIHEAVFSRASDIERIVSNTVTINASSTNEIKNILVEAGAELKNIINIGKENVEVTNRLIQQVPKLIVDIHKDVIERKKAARAKLPQ